MCCSKVWTQARSGPSPWNFCTTRCKASFTPTRLNGPLETHRRRRTCSPNGCTTCFAKARGAEEPTAGDHPEHEPPEREPTEEREPTPGRKPTPEYEPAPERKPTPEHGP